MRMQDALAARAGAVVPAIASAGPTEDRGGDLAGAFPAGAKAVIHCPAPSAASSARARRHVWVLAFEPRAPLSVEPLMGWTSGTDMLRHVRLRFPSREAAVAYAERHGLPYEVREPAHLPQPVTEAGADEAWTLPWPGPGKRRTWRQKRYPQQMTACNRLLTASSLRRASRRLRSARRVRACSA